MFLRLLILVASLASPLQAETRVPQSQTEITLSFAPLVREAAPAVVNIYARQIVQNRSPFADDPFFGRLFRDAPSQPRVQNSLGSGVILSQDGIAVTNYHVVGQSQDIRVVLNDRREYAAQVLLSDEEADLAILQLDGASDLAYLPLRDSDTVEVGELVLAIGNPFGVGQTVSSGIVSGLARSGTATGQARGYFIQTDAPINPGNSGGALIDAAGRLIGVNTSILTRSGGSNGIGFAIPAALVQQFVTQARAGETRFMRPWAGVSGQGVDADLAASLGLDRPGGVVLSDLHPESPFRKAGLQTGDVVLTVDDQPVNAPPEMVFRMAIRGLDAQARVTYSRAGRMAETMIPMVAPPDSPPRDTTTLSRRDVLPGLTVARVNPALIAERGLPLNADGIIVLDPGPFGSRVGLEPGDILRRIDGTAVGAPSDIAPLLRSAAPAIALEAERGNRRILLRFRL